MTNFNKKSKNMKPTLFRPRVSPLALLGGALMNDFDSTIKKMSEVLDRPDANIIENDANYQIEMAIPGFTREDINIEVVNGHLVVNAEVVKQNEEGSNANYRLREFSKNSFKRSFNLFDKVNTDSISAQLEEGILTVTLDKKEEVKPESKKIEIK